MGIDLTRKKSGRQVFGLTLPLITKSDGTKFGKTESGAIWLDPARTSVYRFYQFWIRTDDRDVIKYLKYFTFLPKEEIESLEAQHQECPERREAQKALGKAMTDLIHGSEATQEAIGASEILFGGGLEGITEQTFNDVLGEVPTFSMSAASLEGDGLPLADALAEAGLAPSKGQARKDIKGGGANINNIREQDPQRLLTRNDLLFGKHVLLRKGKKHYAVVMFE
jgi:tyrosyl-tRNA synthetase